jgi:hypothetical protein
MGINILTTYGRHRVELEVSTFSSFAERHGFTSNQNPWRVPWTPSPPATRPRRL